MAEEIVEQKEKEIVEEVKAEEPKSKVFRLEEMIDAMKASKANLNKVLGEQKHLIDAIAGLNDSSFDEFVKSMNAQAERLEHQNVELENKIETITKVVEAARADKNIEDILNLLLNGLGVFEN